MSNKPLDLDAVKCRWVATQLSENEEERIKRTKRLGRAGDSEEKAFEDAIADFFDIYLCHAHTARLHLNRTTGTMVFGIGSLTKRKSLTKLVSLPIILDKNEWVLDNIDAETYSEGGFYASDQEVTTGYIEVTFKRKKGKAD